jgi:indolepyruvate ferredoxin oxidoreductase beta subunit
MNKSILIVGVGGQGTLLTSRVLGRLALSAGYDVKMSEVHGMAQRGGSVMTHVRYGEKVFSPLIEPGGADVVLSFEKMEALRWAHYLKPGGVMVVNDQEIDPMPVITGVEEYPQDIWERLENRNAEIIPVEGLAAAMALGNMRVTNTVLLGALSMYLDEFDMEAWKKAIESTVPPHTVKVNMEAFHRGRELD